MRTIRKLCLIFALWPTLALAVMPDEMLGDPALEARAQAISRELRCVVCQNQTIDDSAAPLARDMRLLVRERLIAGDSDEEVKAYLVARYGNFVLLRPPFQPETWLLWLGPYAAGLIALLGFGVLFRRGARKNAKASAPLSDEERRKLSTILESDSATPNAGSSP